MLNVSLASSMISRYVNLLLCDALIIAHSNTTYIQLAKNVLTFTMLFDGVPFIYQGQEQHFKGIDTPANRQALWLSEYKTDTELYNLIAKLNKIRRHAYQLDNTYVTQQTSNIYTGGSELGFSKGVEGKQVIMLLSTQGTNSTPYDVILKGTYNAGMGITEVLYCKNYTVDEVGTVRVGMESGLPRVFFPTQLMDGSGLCGHSSANISYAELRTGQSGSQAKSLGVGSSQVLEQAVSFALLLALSSLIVVV